MKKLISLIFWAYVFFVVSCLYYLHNSHQIGSWWTAVPFALWKSLVFMGKIFARVFEFITHPV